MLSYIARRIMYMAIMVVLVSFVSFLIIELPPGDFLTQKLQQLQARGDRSAAQRIDEYRARYKLDQPLMVRYWNWISNFAKGDFGESFQFERPVKEIIGQRITMSVILALASILIIWCLAIPIGVYSATHQYSLGDQVITTLAFIGLGMPGFLLALLILFFAMMVLKVEVGGLFSREFVDAPWSWPRVVDLLKHLWIPALISAVTGTAGLIRLMRGNLLETLGQPFVEAARARGLKNSSVTWKHAHPGSHQPARRHLDSRTVCPVSLRVMRWSGRCSTYPPWGRSSCKPAGAGHVPGRQCPRVHRPDDDDRHAGRRPDAGCARPAHPPGLTKEDDNHGRART